MTWPLSLIKPPKSARPCLGFFAHQPTTGPGIAQTAGSGASGVRGNPGTHKCKTPTEEVTTGADPRTDLALDPARPQTSKAPLAGRLAHFIGFWKKVTNNNLILSIVEFGLIIQFVSTPPMLTLRSSPFSPSRTIAVSNEVTTLLTKTAVDYIVPNEDQFVSPIFDVPKKDCNDRRVILNLKVLNSFIRKTTFKLESYENIKSMINRNDYFVSIDLKDAFIMILMHDSCFKYLCFEWEGKRMHYRCMPFGMTSSPRIFTKVFKSVLTFLRAKGIKISAFYDDVILVANSVSLLLEQLHFTKLILKSLGFIPHPVKSMLTPSQSIDHLGFVWNSVNFTMSVPVQKILNLKLKCEKALSSSVSLRFLSKILGTIENFRIAFPYAPLYYRNIQREVANYVSVDHHYEHIVNLSRSSIADLTWWVNCPVPLPEMPLDSFSPYLTLSTDSSETGWGCVTSEDVEAFGFWTEEESSLHINVLESKCVVFAFKALFRNISDVHILIRSDSTTAVAYINNMGGVRSPEICEIIFELYEFCIARNIRIHASHLAGRFNTHADALSRRSRDHCYSLPKSLFSQLSALISFIPEIDLFASRLNYKIHDYFSEGPDPYACKFDAFVCPWPDKVYAFPPIHLVHKFIARFLNLKVDFGLLICPFWPSQIYFPILLDILIDTPFIFPASKLIDAHHLPKNVSLFLACCISSNLALSKEFQRKQLHVSYEASPLQHCANTYEAGKYLQIGVTRGRLIMGHCL